MDSDINERSSQSSAQPSKICLRIRGLKKIHSWTSVHITIIELFSDTSKRTVRCPYQLHDIPIIQSTSLTSSYDNFVCYFQIINTEISLELRLFDFW
jgi:hypothetical protein